MSDYPTKQVVRYATIPAEDAYGGFSPRHYEVLECGHWVNEDPSHPITRPCRYCYNEWFPVRAIDRLCARFLFYSLPSRFPLSPCERREWIAEYSRNYWSLLNKLHAILWAVVHYLSPVTVNTPLFIRNAITESLAD